MSEWPEVEWEEGYPTAEDDDFAAWKDLPLDFDKAARFIIRELPEAAENCCASCSVHDRTDRYDGEPIKRILFSTGGWSGAESLIGFIAGRFDTHHFMESWRRGGHYVFEIPARFLASAGEAGTAETTEIGSVYEHATAVGGDAQTPDDPIQYRGGDVREWQPIETAPKDGTEFDAWAVWNDTGEGERVANVKWGNGYLFFSEEDYRDGWLSAHWGVDGSEGLIDPDDQTLTHWMPLPGPPASNTGE